MIYTIILLMRMRIVNIRPNTIIRETEPLSLKIEKIVLINENSQKQE
jgi:hypothetical protein